MVYVAVVMFIWFLLVTVFTIYGMIMERKAPKMDVFIGFVIGPLLTFMAAFVLVREI